MGIKVRISANEQAIAAKVKDRVALQTRKEAEYLGTAMADNAADAMRELFNMRRESTRRRHPNTPHADEAIWYKVDGRKFPFNVSYEVYGGKEVEKRILGLNYGTPPHYIPPGKAIDKRGRPYLAFPDNEENPTKYLFFYSPVWHPGTSAWNFLETARDMAVEEFFGTPARTRRKPLP